MGGRRLTPWQHVAGNSPAVKKYRKILLFFAKTSVWLIVLA